VLGGDFRIAGPAPDELHAFRGAPYKAPRRFDFVAEFPRTSAGRIRKHLPG